MDRKIGGWVQSLMAGMCVGWLSDKCAHQNHCLIHAIRQHKKWGENLNSVQCSTRHMLQNHCLIHAIRQHKMGKEFEQCTMQYKTHASESLPKTCN